MSPNRASAPKASNIQSLAEAKTLTVSVLEVLAESVSEGQMAQLLRDIPDDFVPSGSAAAGNARGDDEPSFIEVLTARSDSMDPDLAVDRARAVLSTVRDWADESHAEGVVAQLPTSLRDLFDNPST